MRNQTKLNKIKEKKQDKPRVSGEWLYFAKQDTTARMIAQGLEDTACEVEIWAEAGVLEIDIGDGKTVDFEETQLHPKDAVTMAFARENECGKVFLVTFAPENEAQAQRLMRQILEKNGGVFCADTEDLQPILK